MSKQKTHHDRGTWFIAVDILLFLVLLLFVFSMFLWDNEGGNEDPSAVNTLNMLVTIDDTYALDLYREEGKGNPVRVRLLDEEEAFGTIEWIAKNTYLLRCDMDYVKESRYYGGVWELNDLRLLNGTRLSLSTALADFTATVISSPTEEIPGTDFLFETETDSAEETTKEFREDETTVQDNGTTDETTVGGK